MKKLPHYLAFPVIVALALSSTTAAMARTISFHSCVRPARDPACLYAYANQVEVNIGAASPRPGLDRSINGYGTVYTSGRRMCRGTTLIDIHWEYSTVRCPRTPVYRR